MYSKVATDTTPIVKLDSFSGEFLIEGKSIPTNAEEFYKPILDWMSNYIEAPKENTILTLKLDYFNISSSKRILFMFYKLNELVEKGYSVQIKWYFHEGEDDMYEVGQDFAFMVNIPFEFIEYSHYESVVA